MNALLVAWNYELCLWGDQKTLTIGVYALDSWTDV